RCIACRCTRWSRRRRREAVSTGPRQSSIRVTCILMQSAPRETSGLAQSLDPERAPAGALDIDSGAHERQVRERLREVAEQLAAAHVHLLREQAERGAEG